MNTEHEAEQPREPDVSAGRRGNAALTTLDQMLSSASNALLLFVLAKIATPAQFGIAALMMGVLTTAVGFNRGALGTPILLVSDLPGRQIRTESGYATTWSLLSAIPPAAIVCAIGLYAHEWRLGVVFALVMPGVMMQDTVRFAAISLGRPIFAVASDALWTAAVLVLFVAVSVDLRLRLDMCVVVWGICGLAVGILLLVQTAVSPKAFHLFGWWRTYVGARVSFGTSMALNSGSAMLETLAVTVIVGAAQAGGLRGATTLYGPLAMLISALPLVFIPHARRSGASPDEQWRLLLKTALIASVATLVGTGALMVLPSAWGVFLLGEVWEPAVRLVPYIGLASAGVCWLVAVYALFHALGLSRISLRMRLFQMAFQLGAVVLAGFLFGTAQAVAVAMAISSVVCVVVGMVIVARILRESRRNPVS